MSVASIALYSSNSATAEAVKISLGQRVAYGMSVTLRVFPTAAQLFTALGADSFDLLIADAESTPYGGMGVARTLKNEFDEPPPVVLLVAREADAWLATWSRADGVCKLPIDPLEFPKLVATVLRANRKGTYLPLEATAEPAAGISSRHQDEN
ncbi:MAG: response regulator [Propionibacteriaceae bacterium]|nr:response regulator [Propionibacteriaceae bacterium]